MRKYDLFLSLVLVLITASASDAFRSAPFGLTSHSRRIQQQQQHDNEKNSNDICYNKNNLVVCYEGGDDDAGDEEGASLASELFKMAQEKGINLSDDDVLDSDDEESDDEDEEDEVNIPQGAINAFLGYDTGDVGEKLAGNVTLTDDQLYSEVKERVLDTAGGFLEYVKGAKDEEEDEDDEEAAPKKYVPPTTVPDSELTAGEVILTVLEGLNNNDTPETNKGVQILFGYSSEGSQIKNEIGLTVEEYADFLKETEYKVVFEHDEVVIDKADYSFDGKKAFFTARLGVGGGDSVAVNFILSNSSGREVADDSCWMIDSFLIRPQSMRRRRRK